MNLRDAGEGQNHLFCFDLLGALFFERFSQFETSTREVQAFFEKYARCVVTRS